MSSTFIALTSCVAAFASALTAFVVGWTQRTIAHSNEAIARAHAETARQIDAVHTEVRTGALVEQARGFVDALRKTSKQPIVYAELPRAQHAFEMLSSVRAMYTVRAVERFLDVMYCDRRAVDPAPSG